MLDAIIGFEKNEKNAKFLGSFSGVNDFVSAAVHTAYSFP
jgi:hypothetical protein